MRIIMDKKGKKYIARDDEFHTNYGFIKKEDMENGKPGDILKTHLDHDFKVLKANINDYIDLMERKCSIILPKDIGLITAYTGMGSGDRVLDAGTGAGATALHFGNIVGEKGCVYSYEIREDFSEIAKRNVEKFGLQNVEIKNRDVTEGIEEDDLDVIFLDLPKPWDVVENAKDHLKIGGFIATYTPYIEQVQILHRVLKKFEFSNIMTIECIIREIEVKNKGTRPKTRGASHTGYLTFARNL
ncbi:tRNA (adenine-N1)-methyltransferase [Methanobacterium sp. ACI-7]|uniref:tRNA (adenine-N1)-methyltransferase n=1 Tax=unclassified Methanobacterium TaxID=2627676 RepID=UPI0039C09B55